MTDTVSYSLITGQHGTLTGDTWELLVERVLSSKHKHVLQWVKATHQDRTVFYVQRDTPHSDETLGNMGRCRFCKETWQQCYC